MFDLVSVRGLIPARAGKTRTSRERMDHSQAHPRSRGENKVAAVAAANVQGSSPLARGKPLWSQNIAHKPRLIPARAGKTFAWARSKDLRPAHPRSRGENTETTAVIRIRYGSSPLARGKRCKGGGV